MHLVSLESLGFRNLNVNRYTTDYCYRPYIPLNLSGHGQLECDDVQGASHTRIKKTSLWVREKAKTLLNKSEDGSGPGQLECDVVQGVSGCCFEIYVQVNQEVWKCAFLSSNNRLFFKEITIF